MKRLRLIVPVALALVCWSAIAFASGDAGGEHHIPWGNFVFRIINFIIFVAIIWKLAGKKIGEFFGGRVRRIKSDLEDLETRKAEAEKKLREVEKGIANIEQEKSAILDEARSQGEALKEAIIVKAQESADKIKAQARISGENEAQAAMEKMRAELADMVVEAARKMLEEKLGEQDHEKLIDEYLTKVVLN